jgi:hypothetical protein
LSADIHGLTSRKLSRINGLLVPLIFEISSSGTVYDLYGVAFLDANNGWAVGSYGTILYYSSPPQVTTPQSVVIQVIGYDLRLDWNTDANSFYHIRSGIDPMGAFGTWEGSTSDTTFTIVNGAASDTMRFYQVVGATAP